VLVVFKTHKLEAKQQQKCSGKWIRFGRITYAQEIAGPKDIQRIFTNFYGAAPKTVSGQQHPQILPRSN
jgi:hypothetical protein